MGIVSRRFCPICKEDTQMNTYPSGDNEFTEYCLKCHIYSNTYKSDDNVLGQRLIEQLKDGL